MRKIISTLLLVVYVVVGVVVAESNNYLTGLDSLESILSAILAVLLWPLVLFDVDLRIGEGSIDSPSDDKPSSGEGSGDKPSGGEGSGDKPSGDKKN